MGILLLSSLGYIKMGTFVHPGQYRKNALLLNYIIATKQIITITLSMWHYKYSFYFQETMIYIRYILFKPCILNRKKYEF